MSERDQSPIYTLEKLISMPLTESLKILALSLITLPSSINLGAKGGTARFSLTDVIGNLIERNIPVKFTLEDDPRLPKFNRALQAFVYPDVVEV